MIDTAASSADRTARSQRHHPASCCRTLRLLITEQPLSVPSSALPGPSHNAPGTFAITLARAPPGLSTSSAAPLRLSPTPFHAGCNKTHPQQPASLPRRAPKHRLRRPLGRSAGRNPPTLCRSIQAIINTLVIPVASHRPELLQGQLCVVLESPLILKGCPDATRTVLGPAPVSPLVIKTASQVKWLDECPGAITGSRHTELRLDYGA